VVRAYLGGGGPLSPATRPERGGMVDGEGQGEGVRRNGVTC
jgi:hypothetical protein